MPLTRTTTAGLQLAQAAPPRSKTGELVRDLSQQLQQTEHRLRHFNKHVQGIKYEFPSKSDFFKSNFSNTVMHL